MASKFKVGDKVKILKYWPDEVGVIKEITPGGMCTIDCGGKWGTGGFYSWDESFELISQEEDKSYYVCRNVYPPAQQGPYSLTEAEQVAEDFARGDLKDVMVVKLVTTICPTLTVTKKSH